MSIRPLHNGSKELALVRREGRNFIRAVFAFSVFVNLLMLTGPLFMLQVYDRVLASGSQETLTALFILVSGLYAIMAILDFSRGRLMSRFGARFQERIDARVFSAVLEREVRKRPRIAQNNEMDDVANLQSFFVSPTILALCDLPWSPMFFAAIFLFHPLLGWLGLSGGALLVVLTIVNQRVSVNSVQAAGEANSKANYFSNQTLQSKELVLSQGMMPHVLRRWGALRNSALEKAVFTSDLAGAFSAFSKSFRLLLQSGMLALGAYLVLKSELTAGAMIAGSILMGRALQPIELTLAGWTQIQRSIKSWNSLSILLTEIPPQRLIHELGDATSHIKVHSLTAIPPGANAATLRRISFEVKPGEALGIVGASGSGKSSLARCLIGLWNPAIGEVRIGSATLNQFDDDALGRILGYLPQVVSLFPGTIAENIARMAERPDFGEVEAAAKKAHAHELIVSLPEGYNTYISGGSELLSGGQMQRIALARALYGNPSILILDEPNSALDSEGSDALNAAIEEMKRSGKSVILMTHRPGAIAQCDKLLVLKQGERKAFGPRDKVLRTLFKPVRDSNVPSNKEVKSNG